MTNNILILNSNSGMPMQTFTNVGRVAKWLLTNQDNVNELLDTKRKLKLNSTEYVLVFESEYEKYYMENYM